MVFVSKYQLRVAAKILKRLSLSRSKSLRTLVYESNVVNKRALFKICLNCLSMRQYVDEILASSCGAKLSGAFAANEYMLRVVLTEYLCNPHGTDALPANYLALVKPHEQQLLSIYEAYKEAQPSTSAASSAPTIRWTKVNTLKTNLAMVEKHLSIDGFVKVHLNNALSTKRYLKKLAGLEKGQYVCDIDVPNMLAFSTTDFDLRTNRMCEDGRLILQDKSSCLAIEALAPARGAICIELCAAPGMKTAFLSAKIDPDNQGEGQIYSFDKDVKRLKTMRQMLKKFNVLNCQITECDILKIDFENHPLYSQATYAILDPPCTGSGIGSRKHEIIDDDEHQRQLTERAIRLSNLQVTMLKHVLKMPNIKRLVYCTCSVTEQENEKVIAEALSNDWISAKYELEKTLPSWPRRGLPGNECQYTSISSKLVRCVPHFDMTNGFFIACFVRRNEKTGGIDLKRKCIKKKLKK